MRGEYGLDGSRVALWGTGPAATGGARRHLRRRPRAPRLTPADAGQSGRGPAVVDWYGPIRSSSTDDDFRAAGIRRANALADRTLPSRVPRGALAKARARSKATDPITYITPGDPPVLIEHGTADGTVPVGQSERFARAYAQECRRRLGDPEPLQGAGHVDRVFYELENVNDVLDWLDAQLR